MKENQEVIVFDTVTEYLQCQRECRIPTESIQTEVPGS